MNIKKMSIDELEQLSHADIAYELLKESKRGKNTAKLFKEVCKLLKIDDDTMMDMIGDFYTNLTTDKRFILLDNANWDLKENHSVKPIIDEEDEEEQVEEEAEEETEEEQVQEEQAEEETVEKSEEEAAEVIAEETEEEQSEEETEETEDEAVLEDDEDFDDIDDDVDELDDLVVVSEEELED